MAQGAYDAAMWEEIVQIFPGVYKKTEKNLLTIRNIGERCLGRIQPGSRRFLHDNSSMGYGWLPNGWLGEERIMHHGRLYRYYYDPDGKLYYTQADALLAVEQNGIIVLDL